WRAGQSVLDAPHRKPGRKTVQRHLLTGVLGCGRCGHYLSGMHTPRDGHGNSTIVYACKACRGTSIRAEFVVPYDGTSASRNRATSASRCNIVSRSTQRLMFSFIANLFSPKRLQWSANMLLARIPHVSPVEYVQQRP